MKNFKLIFIFFILICLTSCREVPVAENINQYQAHQIINKLNLAGINSKYDASNNGKSYVVSVSRRDYLPAVSLIANSGIMPKIGSEFKELTEPKGFLSSSKSFDLLRLDRAIAVELEETLLSVPSVASAKAVVRLNSLTAGQSPAVSVVVSGRDPKLSQEFIKSFVKNSVPGVPLNSIRVILELLPDATQEFSVIGATQKNGKVLAVPLVSFLIWQVPAGVEFELAWAGIAMLLVAIVVGYFFATLYRRPKNRDRNPLGLPDSGSLALGLQKDLTDEDYR